MKITWLLTGLLVLVALAIPFGLAIAFGNVSNVSSGSMAYWVGVPNHIKSVPIVSACENPLYSAKGRDGTAPARSRVSYTTQASVAHVQAVITSQFTQIGCVASVAQPLGPALSCPNGDEVVINVTQGDPCHAVTVGIYELKTR